MRRRSLILVGGLAVVVGGCSGSGGGGAGPERDVEEGPDEAGSENLSDLGVRDSRPADDAGGLEQELAWDRWETGSETATDAATDPPDGEQEVKPFPPVVPIPPVHLWDCTHDPAAFPGHVSPVPLDCILDPTCREILVVAHRGAGGDFGTIAPENSLAAIRAAIVMGVDGVEIDVRETADGHLVLMHDATVDRTTTGSGTVGAMTLDEVRGLEFRTDKFQTGADYSCERVPTFEEVMDLVRDRVFITLDTKTDRVDLVVSAIVAAGMQDQVFVSVGSFDKAVQARAMDPSIRVWVRPDTLEQVQEATDLFDPDPEVYEIPPELASKAGPIVHALGRKTSADVWGADIEYYLNGDPGVFTGPFDEGLDSQMTEFPSQMLVALGRWVF